MFTKEKTKYTNSILSVICLSKSVWLLDYHKEKHLIVCKQHNKVLEEVRGAVLEQIYTDDELQDMESEVYVDNIKHLPESEIKKFYTERPYSSPLTKEELIQSYKKIDYKVFRQ